MRTPEQLLASATAVLDAAMGLGHKRVCPLYSGGHDSWCACHVASLHTSFGGAVHHIDTGIGAAETRRHVDAVCQEYRWRLEVYRSPFTYERFVRRLGFPGPGSHGWIYNKLKDRCIGMMTKGAKGKTLLITGCRSHESTRRMGHVEPIKVGETSKRTGITRKVNRVWVAPCHDWTDEEQRAYMDEHDAPRNPLKLSLGMSGECFCGAFAKPGEIELIRRHAPDVAVEIDRLTAIAEEAGTPCVWGTRPRGQLGIVQAETGPLCTSCDIRAKVAGIMEV